MTDQVAAGAALKCSMGMSPGTLVVLPVRRVKNNGGASGSANVDDNTLLNIATFGMCQSMNNPSVASATTAANGVLTPMPCVPAISAPWAPGSIKVKIESRPALMKSDTCACSYGGSVTIEAAGQLKVTTGTL